MKLTRIIESLKLPKEARDDLERIIALPEVEAILGREEAQTIKERRELRKQLDALPEKHRKAVEGAEATCLKAGKRFEEAEAEFKAAREARNYAMMVAYGLDLQVKGEEKELKRQLQAGRDTRLDDFYRILDGLEDIVRCRLSTWPIVTRRAFGGKDVSYATNREDWDAAMAVLRDGKRQAEEIALDALSRQEITERLAEICRSLELPLAKFDLTAPTIDQYGDLRPPKTSLDAETIRKLAEKAAA